MYVFEFRKVIQILRPKMKLEGFTEGKELGKVTERRRISISLFQTLYRSGRRRQIFFAEDLISSTIFRETEFRDWKLERKRWLVEEVEQKGGKKYSFAFERI